MTRSQKPVWFPKMPSYKYRGKRPRQAKPNVGPDIDPLDVFRATMDADAGSESSDEYSDAIAAYLHVLSRPDLTKLQKLVNRLQKQVLRDKRKRSKRDAACDAVQEAITQRSKVCAETEFALRHAVVLELESLRIREVSLSDTGRVEELVVDGKKMSIRKFLRSYLADQIAFVKQALASGHLLGDRRRQRPESFVRRLIDRYVSENFK